MDPSTLVNLGQAELTKGKQNTILRLSSFFQCIEQISKSDCPVCLENLHTSREPCQIPPCHHLLHKSCFESLLDKNYFYCPICSKSLVDLTLMWKLMLSQAEKFPMTGKYENVNVNILCRDCNLFCKSKYHVIGFSCSTCSGFNTVRSDDKFFEANSNLEINGL